MIESHQLLPLCHNFCPIFSVKFLPKMDKIVVMKDGRISEQGTYHQLLKAGGEFADFLVEYLAEEAQDESETEELENLKMTLVRFECKALSRIGTG